MGHIARNSFRHQGKRKEVKGIMFIQMKMMSHPRRLQRKMNQVMRSMFLSNPLQELSLMEVTFGWWIMVLPRT
jgi:hypothetical protein